MCGCVNFAPLPAVGFSVCTIVQIFIFRGARDAKGNGASPTAPKSSRNKFPEIKSGQAGTGSKGDLNITTYLKADAGKIKATQSEGRVA